MNKKHIITIGGRPGSGKSSASKGVASQLGYQHFSSGDLMRSIGKEHGMDDIHAVNLAAEGELDLDELVDQRLRDIGGSDDQIVLDSRMAWHWMPYSYKIYLDLGLEIAAARIMGDIDEFRSAHEHIPESTEEYAKTLAARLASESRRYMSLYNVDPFRHEHYDLVIDTSSSNKEQVQQKIIDGYRQWLHGETT